MFELPEKFQDLSPKRRAAIAKAATEERQDAALTAVVMGLKELNQLYGFGLWRLSALSRQWEKDIIEFYTETDLLCAPMEGLPEGTSAGEWEDRLAAFADLSAGRQRKIAEYINQQRREAQWNASAIGLETIRREAGFGAERTKKLVQEWAGDLRNFYQDRDIQEPRLQAWIEEIGFLFEDGKLKSYRTENGKIVRKRTAERQNREEANG